MMRGWGLGVGGWTIVGIRQPPGFGRSCPGVRDRWPVYYGYGLPGNAVSGKTAGCEPLFGTTFLQTTQRFDALFSTYAPHSPLSQLNARAGQGLQAVPAEVVDILRLSQRYAELTNGAFDITVRPLLSLWRQAATRPTAATITRTLLSVGSQKLQFAAPHQVGLSAQGMALDLGGIGKGYALDQVAKQLREQRVTNALLNFGQSSLWALGRPPDGEGWRLLLRQPNGEIVGVATFF